MLKNISIMGKQMLNMAVVLVLMAGIAGTGVWGMTSIRSSLQTYSEWTTIGHNMSEGVIQKLLIMENHVEAYAKNQREDSYGGYLKAMLDAKTGMMVWRKLLLGKEKLLQEADRIPPLLEQVEQHMTKYKEQLDMKRQYLAMSDRTIQKLAERLDKIMKEVVDPAKSKAEMWGNVENMAHWGEVDMVMNEEVIARTLRLVTALHDYGYKKDDTAFAELEQRYAETREGLSAWSGVVKRDDELVATADEVGTDLDKVKIVIDQLKYISQTEKTILESITQTVGQVLALAEEIMATMVRPAMTAAVDKAGKVQKDGLTLLVAISAIGIVLGFLLSWLFARTISRNLGRAARFADEVAKGNFDSSLECASGDEIGQLSNSLCAMVGQLQSMISTSEQKSAEAEAESQRAREAMAEAEEANERAKAATREGLLQAAASLEGIVARITSSSEELSAQAEEISQGMEVQSERISETATSMEEMNNTVLEVARNASEAAEAAGKTREQAESGAGMVEQVNDSFQTVARQFDAMKASMEELGGQANSIGQIMGVINDIADQTNLLALNAAIEAARAGDAGRGFAVVADEVRKLAEKTMTATKDVGGNIQAIQQATKKAVAEMEDSTAAFGRSTELARQSGEALGVIVDYADANADRVRNIATASEQQSSTSEEINRAIEDVNRISAETSDSMRQSAQAISELAGMASELGRVIEELKSA